MQLEKNKSRWLRRWWMETIGSANQGSEQQNEKENTNVNGWMNDVHGGGYDKQYGDKNGMKNEHGRIVFSRAGADSTRSIHGEKNLPETAALRGIAGLSCPGKELAAGVEFEGYSDEYFLGVVRRSKQE